MNNEPEKLKSAEEWLRDVPRTWLKGEYVIREATLVGYFKQIQLNAYKAAIGEDALKRESLEQSSIADKQLIEKLVEALKDIRDIERNPNISNMELYERISQFANQALSNPLVQESLKECR